MVATNVLASTIITTLPAVETQAAEQKLTANLKSSTGALLDDVVYTTPGDVQVTGRVPSGAGKQVTIEYFSRMDGHIINTYSTTADTLGNYAQKVSGPTGEVNTAGVRVTFDNGAITTSSVYYGKSMSSIQLDQSRLGILKYQEPM